MEGKDSEMNRVLALLTFTGWGHSLGRGWGCNPESQCSMEVLLDGKAWTALERWKS